MAKRRLSGREKSKLKISEVVGRLNALAPESCSEAWDNVGLLVGNPNETISEAVVSVDLTAEAIREAKKIGARMIVNHHPCIFPKQRGLSRVIYPSLVFKAAEAGIAVYVSHTNFDRCALEVPLQISKDMGVKILGRLLDEPNRLLKKLVVFVPDSHVDRVHLALSRVSAGHVGNYDSCAFLAQGEGRFRGNDLSRPFIGKAGKLEKVLETRIETVFPSGMEASILEALRQAHPYEEIAYDIYSVEQKAVPRGFTSGLGYGFFGDLHRVTLVSDFIRKIGKIFESSGAIFTPSVDPERTQGRVRRMAFVAGKGGSFISAAISEGCDVFVTGEVGYHDALMASRRGLSVLELGHRESERFYLKTMTSWLQEMGLRVTELNNPVQEFQSFRKK